MTNPRISDAKALCGHLGARSVIVIALSEGRMASASYGETKRECSQIAVTLDKIVAGLASGEIPTWEATGK